MNCMNKNLWILSLALGLTASVAACGEETAEPAAGDNGGSECSEGVCVLTGTITEDLTLSADTLWLLRGGVFIGDDESETVLTIEPGTTVFGETATNGFLAVRRGSKIMAEGTRDAPVVFTSSKEEGSRARGDWGGVIINGRAPVNACADDEGTGVCEAFGEGGTGFYGGNDPTDDSGVLRYVRIEFAGRLISPDNELNGLALQGVGSGTTLDFIQIHMNKDDGVEFFGGTVNFKHILTTGIGDDNLDWTDGWQGKGQFFVAVQYEDAGDNGIEADNNGEDNAASPRSRPILSNVTLIGQANSELSDIGMLMREGTAGEVHNAIVTDWNDRCLDIDNAETFTNAEAGELVVANSIASCANLFGAQDDDPFSVESFFNEMNDGNIEAAPQLIDPRGAAPDFRPASGSPAAQGAVVPQDAFFDQVTFKGGVDPVEDWTAGWTTSVRN